MNKHDLAVLKAGELFLLPGKIPHSPRRADGSWTLVIERKRNARKNKTASSGPAKNAAIIFIETEVRFDDPGDAVSRATQARLQC